MRVLIVDQSQAIRIPSGGTASLCTPTIRPRIQGNRGALRGNALSSNWVDNADLLFSVFPQVVNGRAALQSLKAELRIVQYATNGVGGEDAYPALRRDVSGQFVASNGQLRVPLPVNGVVSVELFLTNLSNATWSYLTEMQVYGDQRAIDVELVQELVGMNQINPALKHALDD